MAFHPLVVVAVVDEVVAVVAVAGLEVGFRSPLRAHRATLSPFSPRCRTRWRTGWRQ